jgi:hypothetical protein
MSEQAISPISLVNEVTFDQQFFHLLQSGRCATHEEAFDYLNKIYYDATGANRYSSYDSYRVCRNRRLKREIGKS